VCLLDLVDMDQFDPNPNWELWSITPFVYCWILVFDARTLLMAIVATVWGCRLTYNFVRWGGYSWPPWRGDEDYRWLELQQGKLVGILTN